MPVMKPTNHAHIESSVILSSRENSRAPSASSGRNASASRQTTIELITPRARAVNTLSFSMIDFPGATALC